MNEQTYYNAKDIAAMLGISMGKAYKILTCAGCADDLADYQ